MPETVVGHPPLASQPGHPLRWSLRLGLVCLVALSASLPIAWVSISKGFLFAYGLAYLVSTPWRRPDDARHHPLWTTRIILALLVAFAASLLWTEADLGSALTAFVRHSKLMSIVLLVTLIKTVQEARLAITVYAVGQAFLLASSWLMLFGIPIPWSVDAPTPYIVFSSYLDQSMMFATAAAIAWHLRNDKLWPTWAGIVYAELALVSVLLLLESRASYLIALTLLSFATMWALPRRWRIVTLVVTPVLVSAGLLIGSEQVLERVTKIASETQKFAKTHHVGAKDSSAWRLNAWHRSAQAIQEKPLLGHGVGAWTPTVKRFQGVDANRIFGETNLSNPHQEYLLWAVELGVGGILLLVALVVGAGRDALRLDASVRRATLSVVAAMALACFFNSALFDDLLGDFFCVSLGLLLALGVRTSQMTAAPHKPQAQQPKAQSPA